MSRHSYERSVTIIDNTEILEIVREEQCSSTASSINMNDPNKEYKETVERHSCTNCTCKNKGKAPDANLNTEDIEKVLKQKEDELRDQYEKELQKEITALKDRFDFILHNEQVRTAYMLREAHRERQEKITALQAQLQCKNIAGLMYVMCSERRKSKLEKMKLIEEYSNYIRALKDILIDGQNLILNLSRGYKTAARVDHEWREKMNIIIKEFQSFIYHFAGGTPEQNQYFFDLPELLKIKASIQDDPEEDPCEEEESEDLEEEEQHEKTWWEMLEDDCRPFVMFGDMAEFKPPQRRAVLKVVKAAKTAPAKWKQYAFNEMFLKDACSNSDIIKNVYPIHPPRTEQLENHGVQAFESARVSPTTSETSRRVTMYANMGSILKIISGTTGMLKQTVANRATLLGARDSMEIQSTTKLREKFKDSKDSKVINSIDNKVKEIKKKLDEERSVEGVCATEEEIERWPLKSKDQEDEQSQENNLGVVDSIPLMQSHIPEPDHKINYEKMCPMEKCKGMQIGSFIRSLPPYMRANPFTTFEQTFEQYEACSPEQLEILMQRIEEKRKAASESQIPDVNPLDEWTPSVEGVAAQTSELSVSLPPCTCRVPSPTPIVSTGMVYNIADLIPVKEALDLINKECFFDNRIEFDRFKVIGQESNESIENEPIKDFKLDKLHDIQKILKNHPSLLDIFQANIRC